MTQSIPASAPTLLLDARAILGEGPRWHAGERLLYWVDMGRNELHRFDPTTGRDQVRSFAEPVGCFAFRRSGGLVLAMQAGFAMLDDWNADLVPFGDRRPLAGCKDLRFNDGRTDPAGRFWAGSVNFVRSARDAALYRLDPDGSVNEIEGEMFTCNAAAFTADGRRFFHADTPTHALRVYDADPATGSLSNRRIFHQFPMGNGRPDGGSTDVEGCYWSALFDGGRVVRLSPAGDILEEVELPVTKTTMIAFGGDDLCTAFVTTARIGLSEEALAEQPLAGGIFTFRVKVPGLPEWPFGG